MRNRWMNQLPEQKGVRMCRSGAKSAVLTLAERRGGEEMMGDNLREATPVIVPTFWQGLLHAKRRCEPSQSFTCFSFSPASRRKCQVDCSATDQFLYAHSSISLTRGTLQALTVLQHYQLASSYSHPPILSASRSVTVIGAIILDRQSLPSHLNLNFDATTVTNLSAPITFHPWPAIDITTCSALACSDSLPFPCTIGPELFGFPSASHLVPPLVLPNLHSFAGPHHDPKPHYRVSRISPPMVFVIPTTSESSNCLLCA